MNNKKDKETAVDKAIDSARKAASKEVYVPKSLRESSEKQGEVSPLIGMVSLPIPELRDDDLLGKIKGAPKPGSNVKIFWTDNEQVDEGYIFATEEQRWDEGDAFVHINNSFDGTEHWKHLFDLCDNELVSIIEVAN